MRDLGKGVEADTDNPAGTGREWVDYTLTAGLTAGAILTGVALVGRPMSNFVTNGVRGVTGMFGGGNGGQDNRWGGL